VQPHGVNIFDGMLVHRDEHVTLSNILAAKGRTVLVHAVDNKGAGLGIAAKNDANPNKRLHLLRRRGGRGAVVAVVVALRKIGKNTALVLERGVGRRRGVALRCNERRSVGAEVVQMTRWHSTCHIATGGARGAVRGLKT